MSGETEIRYVPFIPSNVIDLYSYVLRKQEEKLWEEVLQAFRIPEEMLYPSVPPPPRPGSILREVETVSEKEQGPMPA